jgi:hypothetical protein
VARSAEKIENLRAVVEHFGQEGKNRVLAGKAVAPVWVIVTSQEKLDEVVAAIDDKRVQLARLQDRFKIRVDMAPADIREVATRRVLAKKKQAEPLLRHAVWPGRGDAQDPHPAGAHLAPLRGRTQRILSSSTPTCPTSSTCPSTSSRASACSRARRATSAAATAPSSSRPTRCWSATARGWPTSRWARWSAWTASLTWSRATCPARSRRTLQRSCSAGGRSLAGAHGQGHRPAGVCARPAAQRGQPGRAPLPPAGRRVAAAPGAGRGRAAAQSTSSSARPSTAGSCRRPRRRAGWPSATPTTRTRASATTSWKTDARVFSSANLTRYRYRACATSASA